MKRILILSTVLLAALTPGVFAQSFAGNGTTTLSITVNPEAAISVGSTAAFTNTGTGLLDGNYTGSTVLTFKVRTGSTGTPKITVQMAEFAPATGPLVSAGNLTYTSSTTVGTGVTSTTASTSSATTVVSFGQNVRSGSTTATVTWTVPNLPTYTVDSYSAVATFTISAT